jgi:tRNA-specific 2-thiouridylase
VRSLDAILSAVKNDLNLPPPLESKPVAVAMSGGVDSSVTAALLRYLGYNVVGITLKLYNAKTSPQKSGTCCAGKDIEDAQRVAHRMGFSHFVFDLTQTFKQDVISPFFESYLRGETPVPCVLCNQTVKFRDLLSYAAKLQTEALVTGHYARRLVKEGRPVLCRGLDPQRDQSYFLFSTTAEQLMMLRFPLGGLTKPETRQLARFLELPVAEKPDSQDICFIPNGSYRTFLESLYPHRFEPGDIIDVEGNKLGTHKGISHYTVGQRRGLGVSAPDPLFVISICARNNTVTLGPKSFLETEGLFLRSFSLTHACFKPEPYQPVDIQIRSTQQPYKGKFVTKEGKPYVAFDKPQSATAPGQVCAIYAKDHLLGGGWIERMHSREFLKHPQTTINREGSEYEVEAFV